MSAADGQAAPKLAALWRQLKHDVWDQPTIRSVGAALLTLLVFFIVRLTLDYAQHTTETGGRGIQADTGLLVIVSVGLGTLWAAWEPWAGRHAGQWWWRSGRRWFFGVPRWLQVPAFVLACLPFSLFKVLSLAWSFVDYLLARPAAILAGAREQGGTRRYLQFTAIMVAAISVAWIACDQASSGAEHWPTIGMVAVVVALVVILAVVRRWAWFEADRDTYLIERGGKREDTRPPSKTQRRGRVQRDALLAFLCAAAIIGAVTWQWPLVSRMPQPLLGAALVLIAAIALFCVLALTLALYALWRGEFPLDEDENALRVGFKEDLRDEALFSIVFLLALVPLALDLVYQLSGRTAFVPRDGVSIAGVDLWVWLGAVLAYAALALVAAVALFCLWVLATYSARRGKIAPEHEAALRAEARFSIVFLMALVPLALGLVLQLSGGASFAPVGGSIAEQETWVRLGVWLAYFGAELAKAVPFVDWSEVFHAVNEAPVRPADGLASPIGAQTVFVMRAGLDLLLLATVVQAVSLVSRLREQNIAFANNQLPILEPFSEARELERANEGIRDELDIPPAEQHAVTSFPNYDAKRLRELIEGDKQTPTRLIKTRPQVRRAAVALLAAKHSGTETDAFLFKHAADSPNDPLRKWILDVASGLAPELGAASDADREKLTKLISNKADRRIHSAPVRAAAVRRLGRIGNGAALAETLFARLSDAKEEDSEVRADAAVAIAKVDITQAMRTRAVSEAKALAADFEEGLLGEPLLPAMATAHALARLDSSLTADQVAECFKPGLRDHAKRAAQIQIDPLKTDAAKAKLSIGPLMDELVRIEPGKFTMGFDFAEMQRAENPETGKPWTRAELKEEGWRDDYAPATSVDVQRPFAIGRFPVTNREYRGFCDAMGLKLVGQDINSLDLDQSQRPQFVDNRTLDDRPVVQVTWYDAMAYARWLERITGERYRLPTEAEWEYACRADSTAAYWWGTDDYDGIADIWSNFTVIHDGAKPNPWGLWSLYGHVYEWCADPWHENYDHPKGNLRPGHSSAWLEGCDPVKRVVRGGSFNWPRPGDAQGPIKKQEEEDDAKNARRNEVRSAYRNSQVPSHIQTNYGFRLARSLAK